MSAEEVMRRGCYHVVNGPPTVHFISDSRYTNFLVRLPGGA